VEAVLRLTEEQYSVLRGHLFPGDGKEAVAIALCGRRDGDLRHCMMVRKLLLIPHDQCQVRTPVRVTWPTEMILPLLEEAMARNLAIVKIHSHPRGLRDFSRWDDLSDRELFTSIHNWTERESPNASVIMLPDGTLFGRLVGPEGAFELLHCISVVGHDLQFWYPLETEARVPEFAMRHTQAFGEGTTKRLGRLCIAVIGCSGTGSIVAEQLARLGAGKLILVDPDRAEEKNLNRILNATIEDALAGRFKVDVLQRAIVNMGLGTQVTAFAKNLYDPEVIKAVAQCDIVFGCMDSVDGRHLLNRVATFYLLPYFDVGVKLEADGSGGIDQICGTIHYLQPGKSSLLSRGLYNLEQVRAAGLKRTDPDTYQRQLKEKYIVGVQEERPAVISVNMVYAALAVNEMLARLHPYRDDDNKGFTTYRFSLTQAQIYTEPEGEPCRLLARHVGRGDVRPLLDMPELSEMEDGNELASELLA
jgi:hypothetical protein